MIQEKRYPLSLGQMIDESGRLLKEKMDRPFPEVKREVLDFLRIRYQNFLLDKGYGFDTTEAVLSLSFDELVDIQGRIDALRKARESRDFESIVIAFKRAMNILKGVPPRTEINPSLFSEDVEKNLHDAFLGARGRIEESLGKKDYDAALQQMIQMKKPIDDFFDGVMSRTPLSNSGNR